MKKENTSFQKEFYTTISEFYKIPIDSLSQTTRISNLSKNPHDLILFTFEVEKKFHIEFGDDEIEKLDEVSSYLNLIKRKLKSKSAELKKAA
jgi:hypothetical protein